jgi:hypothetical protein
LNTWRYHNWGWCSLDLSYWYLIVKKTINTEKGVDTYIEKVSMWFLKYRPRSGHVSIFCLYFVEWINAHWMNEWTLNEWRTTKWMSKQLIIFSFAVQRATELPRKTGSRKSIVNRTHDRRMWPRLPEVNFDKPEMNSKKRGFRSSLTWIHRWRFNQASLPMKTNKSVLSICEEKSFKLNFYTFFLETEFWSKNAFQIGNEHSCAVIGKSSLSNVLEKFIWFSQMSVKLGCFIN